MISVDDYFLSQNITLPLSECLHSEVLLLVIGGIPGNNIKECLDVIGHWISMLNEDCTNSIVKGIYLNIEWLL
jgi:hypothetical protein